MKPKPKIKKGSLVEKLMIWSDQQQTKRHQECMEMVFREVKAIENQNKILSEISKTLRESVNQRANLKKLEGGEE